MDKHQEFLAKAQVAIERQQDEVAKGQWRLRYHVAPPAGWMNDPNGFCFYKGEYHLFYQHYPHDSVWGPMHWGHVKSRDLATWEHLPIALAPSEEYDQDGCFSGSAITVDGQLYLMYTGHVWTGENHDHDLKQTQCLAVSDDGVTFSKVKNNPVIAQAPDGDVHPLHFRDPKVWKHGESYYCVIGSKTVKNTGQVLLYRSTDLFTWEFIAVAARGEGNFGFMWECPDLFQLDDQDVLVMSPQGMEPEGDLYHNVHQSGYVKGQLNYETGILDHGEFHLLDHGFDFYAPQTTIDDQGRRILMAWMNMWESPMPEQKEGWAGAMTVPRVLTLEDGKVKSRPVPELTLLRKEAVQYEQMNIQGTQELPGIEGSCLELKLAIDLKEAKSFTIKLRVDEEAKEETILTYETESETFSFDRSQSGQGPGGVRKAHVKLENHHLMMHIFLDESSLEVFLQDGELAMTGRIYPGKKADRIQFVSDGEVTITSLEKWSLI